MRHKFNKKQMDFEKIVEDPSDRKKEKGDFVMNFNYFFLGMLTGGILMCLIINICEHDEPEAIDVYRNKTVLKITTEGGVPKDTTVIFKK